MASNDQLIGAWTLELVENVPPDGSRVHVYGDHPPGLFMFDRTGHHSLLILTDGRLKFASNDKSKGTPEEYRTTVQGSNCHFGRYTINPADHSITLHVDQATFANWEGLDLTWPFMVSGNESTFTVPHLTTGGAGAVGKLVFKRAS
jgi:hypothetical protein